MASVQDKKHKFSARNSSTGNTSDRPPNSVGLRHPLKFKRPPAVANQTQNASANQSSMLRRVSSARNPNSSVVESLQQFMQSRSNSAVRSRESANSCHNEQDVGCDEDNSRTMGGVSNNERVNLSNANKALKRDSSRNSK